MMKFTWPLRLQSTLEFAYFVFFPIVAMFDFIIVVAVVVVGPIVVVAYSR